MPPGSKGVRAGRTYIEVGTNNSPLHAGLKRASARLKAFGASVTGAGMKAVAIGGAPVWMYYQEALTAADNSPEESGECCPGH